MKVLLKKTARFARSLLAGVCTLFFIATGFAEEEVIEEVVVTGSRLATTSNETASQPIASISEAALSKSGQFDIAEVLNDSPSLLNSITATNSLDSSAANIGQTQNFGGSALDLRGLGYSRTLTLVNGRRHVAGVEGTAAVDISTIPSALIERVDVLSGGASAVYGADALTGVVNVILKEDFEGVEIGIQGGADEKGDNNANRFSIIAGKNIFSGRGNVTMAMQVESDSGLLQGQRSFLANNALVSDDQNPLLRFQKGDLSSSSTPNLSQYYNFANTGLFPWGLRIPTEETFIANYTDEFGTAPTLTSAESALFTQAANAYPQALLPGRTFNITSPYGVVVAGDFGVETALGDEPDLDGDGTPDCLQSFTGYNSSLGGAGAFGIAGGCWVIQADGSLRPYTDGLVAGSFNHFGASDSYIRPNRVHAIPKKNQKSIDLNGYFDISDTTSIFWETKYVFQQTEIYQRYHNFTDLLHGKPDNPFLPAALKELANNSGLGFAGIEGGLHISRDSDDWGDNLSSNSRSTLRGVFGIEGDINENFSYEVTANFGKFERKMIDRDAMMADRFFAAIDAVEDPETGEAVCRSSLDPTAYPATTPFNIFQFVGGGVPGSFFTFTPGDGQCQPMNIWGGRGAMSQESIDFVTFDRVVREEIEQQVYSALVVGDTEGMFSLPGGPIGIAAGVEWRTESSSQTFGDLDQGILPVSGTTYDGQTFASGSWVGDVSNAKSLGPVPSTRVLSSGSEYDFTDYFVELGMPLLSEVPLAYELNLDLAFRSSDNSIFGENDTLKYGVSWAPIMDVRFRYTYSEATRVPNLFELFSPEQGARFRPDDPCDKNNIATAADSALRTANCVADLKANGVVDANIYDSQGDYAFEDPLSAGFPGATSGNQNLKPESGETITYGIVLAPRFLEGLVVSFDYLEIDISDAILSVSSQNIVNKCYDSATLANEFCALISRNDDPASAQSGGLDFLRQVQLNFGAAIYEGYDATASYDFMALDTAMRASVSWSTVEKILAIEQTGTEDNELGEMRRPENSATFSLSGIRGDFGLEYSGIYLDRQTLNYEGGTEIETVMTNFGPTAFTDEVTVHNIRGTYTGNGFTVYGGVNNFTDESPYISELAYPVSPLGRYFYLGATMSL